MGRSMLLENSRHFFKYQLFLFLMAEVQGRFIDLTYDVDQFTIHWPTTIPFELTVERAGFIDNKIWIASNRFKSGEHLGTHLDAPYHYNKDGWTLDQIPIDRLIVPAAVVNISERAQSDPDTTLQLEDLKAWENEYGPIPKQSLVLLFSGWGRKWPNKTEYLGTKKVDDPSTFHCPAFSEEAVLWLVKNRNIVGIGLDTISMDKKNLTAVHETVTKHNLYGLENLANLHLMPPKGATVIALPMKIKKGTGSPTRVVAFFNDEKSL